MVKLPRHSAQQEEPNDSWILTNVEWRIEQGNDPTIQFSLINRENGTRVQSDSFPIMGVPDLIHQNMNDGMYSVEGHTIHIRFPNFTFDINLTGYENDNNMVMNLAPLSSDWLSADTLATEAEVRAEGLGYGLRQGNGLGKAKKTKIPYPKRLKCTVCNAKIHNPENIEEFLGVEETRRYIAHCKKMKMKPQIFCCTCFPSVQSNPTILNAWHEMKEQVEKFNDLNHKEKELERREKELDRELKKIRKKKK